MKCVYCPQLTCQWKPFGPLVKSIEQGKRFDNRARNSCTIPACSAGRIVQARGVSLLPIPFVAPRRSNFTQTIPPATQASTSRVSLITRLFTQTQIIRSKTTFGNVLQPGLKKNGLAKTGSPASVCRLFALPSTWHSGYVVGAIIGSFTPLCRFICLCLPLHYRRLKPFKISCYLAKSRMGCVQAPFEARRKLASGARREPIYCSLYFQ